METVKIPAVAGGKGEGAQRTGTAVELLCVMLQWWVHGIMHLSKPIEGTTPKVNLNINLKDTRY